MNSKDDFKNKRVKKDEEGYKSKRMKLDNSNYDIKFNFSILNGYQCILHDNEKNICNIYSCNGTTIIPNYGANTYFN